MSVGQYTHITRSAGTIVSASIYNTDHRNHVTNDVPTSAGAHSDDVTMMRATTDPAPAGVATPVLSLGSELEQLRFVLQDVASVYNGGTPPAWWYVPVTGLDATSILAHGARITRSSAANVPLKTQFPIVFDTVIYDTGIVLPSFDPFFTFSTPTRLTAPKAGLYVLNGFGTWQASGVISVIALALRHNGTVLIAGEEVTLDGTSLQRAMSVGAQYHLAAGDYIELLAFQTAASPLQFTGATLVLELLNLDATFASPTLFALSITESGSGTGVVTANLFDDFTPTTITCPGVCSESFVASTQLWVHATPDGGSAFVTWSGDVPIGHETDNPVLLTMDQARTVDAQFDTAGVVVSFKLATVAFNGKVTIDDGTGPNVYTVTTADTDTILQTSTVPDLTLVSMTCTTDGVTPLCIDPGQVFNSDWTSITTFNCGSGWQYKAEVTVDAGETPVGQISFEVGA